MRTALIAHKCMNFINDHSFNETQCFAAFRAGEHQVQGFRCGDQDMRRPQQHGATLVHQGVAGADTDANRRQQQTVLPRLARGQRITDAGIADTDLVTVRAKRLWADSLTYDSLATSEAARTGLLS